MKLPQAKTENIVVQNLQDETLIYDLSADKVFCLNPTAAFVWHNCDGHQSVAEISRALARSSRQLVAHDVIWLAIEELKSIGLMEECETPFDGFKTTSRREAIKRIGLASTIALPVIAGLLAPKAADAASGTTNTCGQSCSNNSTCTTASCANCRGNGLCGGMTGNPCSNIGSPCEVGGICTNVKSSTFTCSVGGGTCFSFGPCSATYTCTGTGTCQA